MTDSESETNILPGRVFAFQNENTTVCAKGPNINNTHFTNLSFRNNVMTSTMQMSRNFGRSLYGEPSFDQRSMYCRRETSPLSLYSASDMHARNQSYYHRGISSQRSMYNGRSGSPTMSMRSIDSNASVSAVDIAMAFKNVNFNKNDLKLIKEAYNKFMKRRIRKKVEKRRNMRLFLKGYRRKSGFDSGELSSDSSISSDDCKSTASAMYKDNMSSCRSTRTDLTDFRKRIKENNMYNYCTENFKQSAMKNMFQVPPDNAKHSLPLSTVQSQQGITQKDRFRNGFLLPSQRFNKSIVSLPIPERNRLQGNQNALKPKNHLSKEQIMTQERVDCETDSDQEEIFSNITERENHTLNYEPQCDKISEQGKRNLENEETSCSIRKRAKLSTPMKQQKTTQLARDTKGAKTGKNANSKIVDNEPSEDSSKVTAAPSNNDFEFIKPILPVRKSGNAKIKEKLISKSAPPLVDTIMPSSLVQGEKTTTEQVTQTKVLEEVKVAEQPDATQNTTSDLSLRPSFIKRKLFSQKMDVTERKNMSSEAINVNSPQTNVYSAIQNEKHKARKLVTSQSCLSRDIVKEDTNLLDLIHKIVPPDRMNVTNVISKTSLSHSVSNKNNQIDEDDKWDVTSVISTCNNDNVSDTYTDEEIFATDEKRKKTNNDKAVTNNNEDVNDKTNKMISCKIVVEKLPKNVLTSQVEVNNAVAPNKGNDNIKKSVYNCVKSFWDTDFESDVESTLPKKWMSAYKENQMPVKGNHTKSIYIEADKTTKIENKNNFHISLASVSESIKSRTMPTNNMGKLKLNISKQLNIKSFLSPKNTQSKNKKLKLDKVSKQVEKLANKDAEDQSKQASNPITNSKLKRTILDSKSINNEEKSSNLVKDKNNKIIPSPDKTKKGKQTNKVNDPSNQSQSKSKRNNKSSQSANVSKTKINKQPTKQAKAAKSPNATLDQNVANTSISVRPNRTPKRKACCDAEHESSKAMNKANGNPSKKSKLIESSPDQRQPAKKLKENIKPNNRNDKNKNKQCAEPDLSLVDESVTSDRTLRSRRIDLSTSINSSTENLTTLKLRTRLRTRIDLSSSLKNSSLDETVIKNLRSRTQAKKPPAKPGYADLLNKRRRR